MLNVSVNCSNEIEFSFGANYMGFAQTVTYIIKHKGLAIYKEIT